MLLAGWVAALAGLLLSAILFTYRSGCEPVLAALLPYVTRAIFRSALYYEPQQYYWIAAYVGGFSAFWAMVMVYIVARAPAENRRVDAALMKQIAPQQSRGAILDP